MEKTNNIQDQSFENQAADKLHAETNPVSERQNLDKPTDYEHIEKDLNSKILKITMWIMDHYPELSKYLEEMPVTVPSEKDPEITLSHLNSYYESLNSLLKKYKVDYPKIEE